MKLPIPIKALEDCGAILGRRGAGKSGTGRAILEHELDAGHRCCVIDPKGDWYGIRANKDGSPSRFDIPVFGGKHADVPIDDSMGAALGTIVATSATSSVIDLSGFSRAGMLRFMLGFAEALFMNNRQPLTLLVDEADQLAPQKVPIEVAKVLHFMEALIRQGRQRGIFMWMLTQRPAVINKNLLSQAETLIAMQMTGPQDRKAIRDWMDAHDPEKAAEVSKDLAKLTVGQAWAWVPGADFLERVQFPLFETYDSGRTPKHGEPVDDVVLPKLDVAELARLLKPEADAEDGVDELAAALAEANRLRADNARLRHIDRERVIEGDRLIGLVTDIRNLIGAAIGSPAIDALPIDADLADYVMRLDADGVIRPMPRRRDPVPLIADARRRMRDAPPPPVDIAAVAAGFTGAHFNDLTPAQRRILAAIAAARGKVVPIGTIAELAGVSPTSSNITVALPRLAERAFVRAEGRGYAAMPVLLSQEAANG